MTKKGLIILISSISAAVVAAAAIVTGVLIANHNKNKVTARQAIVESFSGSSSLYYNDTETELYTGATLKDGNTLLTGLSSNIYMKIDNDKTVKLDEDSKMKVEKMNNKEISLNLLYGEFYFNVENKLSDDETMEFTAGQTTMSIRGTIGYGSYRQQLERLEFYVFSGEVVVSNDTKEEQVYAGKKIIVDHDDVKTENYSIEDISESIKEEIKKSDASIEAVSKAFEDRNIGSLESNKEFFKGHTHVYEYVEKDASHHKVKCASCDYTATVDHSNTNNVTIVETKKATCDEDGYYTITCKDCGESWTTPIPKLEHNYDLSNGVVTKEPTCAYGETTYTCTLCNGTKAVPNIYPLYSHTYSDAETTVNSTAMSYGKSSRTCTECGEVEVKSTGLNSASLVSVAGASIKNEESKVVSFEAGEYSLSLVGENSDFDHYEAYRIDTDGTTGDAHLYMYLSSTSLTSSEGNLAIIGVFKDQTITFGEPEVYLSECGLVGINRIKVMPSGDYIYYYTDVVEHDFEDELVREGSAGVSGAIKHTCKNCDYTELEFFDEETNYVKVTVENAKFYGPKDNKVINGTSYVISNSFINITQIYYEDYDHLIDPLYGKTFNHWEYSIDGGETQTSTEESLNIEYPADTKTIFAKAVYDESQSIEFEYIKGYGDRSIYYGDDSNVIDVDINYIILDTVHSIYSNVNLGYVTNGFAIKLYTTEGTEITGDDYDTILGVIISYTSTDNDRFDFTITSTIQSTYSIGKMTVKAKEERVDVSGYYRLSDAPDDGLELMFKDNSDSRSKASSILIKPEETVYFVKPSDDYFVLMESINVSDVSQDTSGNDYVMNFESPDYQYLKCTLKLLD